MFEGERCEANKNKNKKEETEKKRRGHVETPAARPQSFQSCLITCPVIGKSPHKLIKKKGKNPNIEKAQSIDGCIYLENPITKKEKGLFFL
jgi:hypothetical protein